MKNIFVRLLTVFLSVLMLCSAIVPISATENTIDTSNNTITPYLNNYGSHTFYFNIDDSGVADVVISYMGKADYFTQAKVTVKIQKRTLLLFWTTVDIGEPNNLWIDTSTEVYGRFHNAFQLEKTGTYRCVITFEVSGTGGATDVIEDTLEAEYK